MTPYFILISATAIILAFGIFLYSYRVLRDTPFYRDAPQEHVLMWAFGRLPDDLENIPELIKLWNAKHGDELIVKEDEDVYKVMEKIIELWEKENVK
jgi:ABC-type glycerol-3-phosphate transport system substrate-binding protein